MSLFICCVPTVSPIETLSIFTALDAPVPEGDKIISEFVVVIFTLSKFMSSTCNAWILNPVLLTSPIFVLFWYENAHAYLIWIESVFSSWKNSLITHYK